MPRTRRCMPGQRSPASVGLQAGPHSRRRGICQDRGGVCQGKGVLLLLASKRALTAEEEANAKIEEVYARAKESCFCWPPSGPSQPKKRQMPKETKNFPSSKNQLNSLRKASAGRSE